MKKLLFLTVIVVLAISVYAGANYDGMDFANGVTIGGTATIRVHQWLDIDNIDFYITEMDIRDYNVEYTYDPKTDSIMAFFVIKTNADLLKVKVTGSVYDKNGVNEMGFIGNGLLTVKYVFYQWSPHNGNPKPPFYIPRDEDGNPVWQDLGTELIMQNYTDISSGQHLALGMMLVADKDLPAGEYKFVYNVIFNPTVTF